MSCLVIDSAPAITPAPSRFPRRRPALRCRPDLVSGIPMARDSLPLADEMPKARFQENDRPNFLPMVQSVGKLLWPGPGLHWDRATAICVVLYHASISLR